MRNLSSICTPLGYLLIATLSLIGVGCVDQGADGEFFDAPTLGEYDFDGQPQLDAPDAVSFGGVQLGEVVSEVVTLENEGRDRLMLYGWYFDGALEVDGPPASVEEPQVLRPGESLELTMEFTAQLGAGGEYELLIGSNDPDRPLHVIAVDAEVLVPCLKVEPEDEVEFGEVTRDIPNTKIIDVVNCDDRAELNVAVEDVAGDDVFEASFPGGVTETTVEPGSSVGLQIVFTAPKPEDYGATVHLSSDDPEAEQVAVDIMGRGAPYECIKPIIEAQAAGGGVVSSDDEPVLNAAPLDVISLDGSASHNPTDGQLESIEWTLVQRPDDSGAHIADDEANDDEIEIFLDLAGTYVVELDAVNDNGEWACAPAKLTIMALVGSDIHVQLVWDTPGDPNRHNDDGTDLDLHFLHPDGQWNEAPYDCYWQNPAPQWPGGGDPTLDIDATQGWGPENVNLDGPEPGVEYAVGVNYFTDRGYGPSKATIRVFLEGELEAEIESDLMDSGEFWDAARIDWSGDEVTVIDEVYEGA